MIKKSKIPTILGVIILVIGTFAGVFFLNMRQVFRIGAQASAAPKDVRVANTSDNSVTVSWTTDVETTAFLSWGQSTGSVNKIEKESDNSEKFFTHSISLTGLTPGADYYYKINSDGTNFDNNGVPWQLTTGPALNINQGSYTISGSVVTATGQPAARALVYVTLSG